MSSTKPAKLELQAEFPYEEEAEHVGMGTTRLIGYAVKGTPFRLTLKVVSKSKVSLSHVQVHLQLLTEETYAPVDIGERPVKWEFTTSGSMIICETRLLVLSTQLAKSCVVIKATVTLDGQKPMEVLSCPVRVVSKPEQIRRKRKEANQDPELEGSKKRARSEDVLAELRSLNSQTEMLLQEMRQSQAASEMDVSFKRDSDSLIGSDDETTLHEWTTDDGGEPSSFLSNETMSDTGLYSLISADHSPPMPKRSSLVSTFENLLHSFEQCHSQGQTADIPTGSLQKLKAAFNLLDLPQSMDTDEYH